MNQSSIRPNELTTARMPATAAAMANPESKALVVAGAAAIGRFAAAGAAAAFFSNLIPGVSLMARLVASAACLFMLWTMQASHHTGMELTHTHFFGPNAPKPFPGTEEVIRLRVE